MAWMYGKNEPEIKRDTKGHSGTRIAYSTDGKRYNIIFTVIQKVSYCSFSPQAFGYLNILLLLKLRLFTCGTFSGKPVLLEWNDDDGVVKRVYNGLSKQAVGIVDFDVAKNRFLVAGDESRIKFWETCNKQLE